MELYLSVLAAAVIYGLIDFVSKEGKEVFKPKYILTTLVNVLAGSYLVWALNLKPNTFMVGNIDILLLVAGAFGVFGQKLFKSLMYMANKNIKTKFGINRKK